MNIDNINLGTASSIQIVTALPSAVGNYQQGTLFKLPTGAIYRLTKPIFNAAPAPTDFELLFGGGKLPLTADDIILVSSNSYYNMSQLQPNQEILVICTADAELTLGNTRIINRRPTDSLMASSGGGTGTTYATGLNLKAGEVFYVLYRSPTESYYERYRDPSINDVALKYECEYWVSKEKGSPTNHGQSIEAPYESVANFTAGWIDYSSRVNLMSSYQHDGGWTLADQHYITFEGSGTTTMMYGGIQIIDYCHHITFRNLNIASDTTWGGQQAIKFDTTAGDHLLENIYVTGNTATSYIEFGTRCTNTTADGLTTFGEKVCTFRDCDFTGSTGNILLPDLAAGDYAYIKLENSQVSGISVGDGWYVLYDADSQLGAVSYTGSATNAQLIITSNIGLTPKQPGGIIAGGFGGAGEVVPTAPGQVPVSIGFGSTVTGVQYQDIVLFPNMDKQINNATGSNISSLIKQFTAADGNYQSYSVWIDIWEAGSGSGLMSRHVYLELALRMDLIAAAGSVNINEFIVADRQAGAQKGALSLVYNNSGYGGGGVELKYDIPAGTPYANLNSAVRILAHTTGA